MSVDSQDDDRAPADARHRAVWRRLLGITPGVMWPCQPAMATPGRARSNDLAGRSTALAPPCLLLCFGNSVNSK